MEQTDTADSAVAFGGLSARQFALVSRAIADPRRYAMLSAVAASVGPCPCGALIDAHDVSAATISHHLKELETAGLITIVREGRFANIVFQRAVFESYVKQLSRLQALANSDPAGSCID